MLGIGTNGGSTDRTTLYGSAPGRQKAILNTHINPRYQRQRPAISRCLCWAWRIAREAHVIHSGVSAGKTPLQFIPQHYRPMIRGGVCLPTLREVIGRSIILTYKEEREPIKLEAALREEGLRPEIVQASYTPDQMRYARATRTFMNHYNGWKHAAEKSNYTLICYFDFVPCVDLGSMPTFWPLRNPLAWGYLYQGSPRLLALIGRELFHKGIRRRSLVT